DDYRAPLPCETRTYELVGYTPAGPGIRFQPADFVTPTADAAGNRGDGDLPRLDHRYDADVTYETAPAAATNQRRLIAQTRTVYRPDDLGAAALDPLALLPLGQAGTLALSGESYQLAFTPGLLAQVYQRPLDALPAPDAPPPTPLLPAPADVLPVEIATGRAFDRGGYLSSEALRGRDIFPLDDGSPAWTKSDEDGHWWLPSGRVFYSPGPDDPPAAELTNARQRFFLPHRVRDQFGANATVAYDGHALLPILTRDAVGNTTSAGERDAADNLITATIDYRTLQPALVADPNGNRAAVAFDALGLVVGTAVMGKAAPAPAEGDNLNEFAADLTRREIDEVLAADDPRQPARAHLAAATTRIIHDVDRFQRTRRAHPGDPADPTVIEQWLPAVVATVARERHAADLAPGEASAIQISFAYSDGFGRDIQRKIQAEPGPVVDGGDSVSPRWVGSGWTIFNNKGKPVRQYEPFYSQLSDHRHRYEFGVAVGVSPILFYDPPGRVIATLHPNQTYEKVVFDPWRQITYDANDTAAPFGVAGEAGHQTGDPRTDSDIAGYVAAYFAGLDDPAAWRTWYEQRHGGEKGPREQSAAAEAAKHANTPASAHFDTLGRPFITLAHNGFGTDGAAKLLPARVELDIEGNQRTVRDAIVANTGEPGRVVARYHYDMLGNRIHQASLEAGERWLLSDVTGKTIRAWDSRGHAFITDYDPLRRPLRSTVVGADPARSAAASLVERLTYGEQVPNAQGLNLRGQLHRHCDQAGVTTTEAVDFKGNPLRASRRLARVYKETVDWRDLDVALPAEATAALTATEEAAVTAALDQIAEAETFRSATRYDALNRAIQVVPPHGEEADAHLNVIQPVYNEANLLEQIQVWLEVATVPDELLDPATLPPARAGVANIDYDAKGQRQRIDYQNGASTFYQYDPETFRLTALYTR
ncbi:MAG: toxin, partial [Chloroflexota bacterium]|nr:toxin [Chloroflexota bacterium]